MNDIDPNEKAKEEEKASSVHQLMEAIKRFDCEQGVFKVLLIASDTLAGFDATASFRSGKLNELSSQADTPEEALDNLYNILATNFSRCPSCGQFRNREA